MCVNGDRGRERESKGEEMERENGVGGVGLK